MKTDKPDSYKLAYCVVFGGFKTVKNGFKFIVNKDEIPNFDFETLTIKTNNFIKVVNITYEMLTE